MLPLGYAACDRIGASGRARQACIPFSRSPRHPTIVGCILLAKPILEAVYGPELVPASQAFRVLIVAEVIFFFRAGGGRHVVGPSLSQKAFLHR